MNASNYQLSQINGYNVIVNDLACLKREFIQVKFPKSRKKRIRKKWSKRTENYGFVEKHICIQHGNILYVSQKIYDQLKLMT